MSTSAGSTRCAIWLADNGVLEAAVMVLAANPCKLPINPPAAAPAASATAPVVISPRLWLRRGGGGGSLAYPAQPGYGSEVWLMGVALNSMPQRGYVLSLRFEHRFQTWRRAEGNRLLSRKFPEGLLKAFRFAGSSPAASSSCSSSAAPSHSRAASPIRAGTRSRDRRISHAVPL